MKFSIMGFTVANAEQARSILMVAMQNGDMRIAQQCVSVIAKYETSPQA